MAEQTPAPQAGQSSAPVRTESPGGRPMGAIGITLITLYLTVVTVVVFHSLVVLWPPNRDTAPTAAAQGATQGSGQAAQPAVQASGTRPKDLCGEPAEWEKKQRHAQLFWLLDVCLSDEERLFLIVMFAGALGGLVHTLRSFYWYAGCRRLVLSWTGFYITQPILGATLATVFYLVVRGGFFSPQSEISDTSPFGFAALAALIGMFTEQASEKLKQIAENLFAIAPKGADHAGPPTVTGVSPTQGSANQQVTITGSGFVQNATVTFDGQAAANVQVASGGTSLTAETPATSVPGAVTVEVTNPDGQKGSLANGFTYQ
jgi:hypothetical protein